MRFEPGEFVSYGGRSGRVRGIESVRAAGIASDVLVIALSWPPSATMRVPVAKAGAEVKRISEAEAEAMLADIPMAQTLMQQSMERARARKRPS